MKVFVIVVLIMNISCKDYNKSKDVLIYNCEIELKKIKDINYLRSKMVDFNSEETDCLEAFFSQSKIIFEKKM